MARLVVDPLTRVEGHGRVELELRRGRLAGVKVRMLESPRLFEALVLGRRYDEVPDLVCRICAICSAVHKLTSLRAMERALTIDVPPLAEAIRELLLLGGHLESHALHLFCLVLPDFSDRCSVVELMQQRDPLAKAGLGLKAFGNCIQESAGGRVIHPINPVVGGVVYRPGRGVLEALLRDLDDWQAAWPGLAADFRSRSNYPAAESVCGSPLATGRPDHFTLAGDLLWSGAGQRLPVADYAEFLAEGTVEDSYAKSADGHHGPFLTGALARSRLAAGRGCGAGPVSDHDDIHANNDAQLEEIGWAMDRMRQLIEILLAAGEDAPLRTQTIQVGAGTGTAAMEAPRGLLIHHYVVDEWGQVAAADIITPTAINQRAMALQIMADLGDEKRPEILKGTAERIIRSFDPCISCAVHLVRV